MTRVENCQARNAETCKVKARRNNALINRRARARARVIQLAIASPVKEYLNPS